MVSAQAPKAAEVESIRQSAETNGRKERSLTTQQENGQNAEMLQQQITLLQTELESTRQQYKCVDSRYIHFLAFYFKSGFYFE